MKKYVTTYWLDLLTYIIIPFIAINGIYKIVSSLFQGVLSWLLLLEFVFVVLYVLTFFNSHNRTKLAYILFRILITMSAIRAVIDFILKGEFNWPSFIVYSIGCVFLWIYPNEIYLKKRKHLFKNENKLYFSFLGKVKEVKKTKNKTLKNNKKNLKTRK